MGDHGSDMEKMIDLFLSMDKNQDDHVDKEELRQACVEKKLDMKQVNDWLSRYDTNKDGRLSLDEFCDGLGLNEKEMAVEKVERDITASKVCPTLNSNIKMIDYTMSIAKQVTITDKFIEYMKGISNNPRELNNVAAKLKKFLDDQYGRVWQVVLVAGPYWINYSHAPLMSMQFQHGRYICVVWRTTVN